MNAHDRLQRARELTFEGRFEEALAEFEWFHDNALAEEPALRGVRRSFALSYWAELGTQYEPALKSLMAIRDRDRDALLSGTHESGLFADVSAINRYLQDEPATYRLFLSLHESTPKLANDCFDSAIEAVVAAQDFQLARCYIPNPRDALSGLLRDFNDSVGRAFQLSDKRRRARRLQAYTSNFVSDVRLLLNIVRRTDGEPETAQLTQLALAGVTEEAIRKRVARRLDA